MLRIMQGVWQAASISTALIFRHMRRRIKFPQGRRWSSIPKTVNCHICRKLRSERKSTGTSGTAIRSATVIRMAFPVNLSRPSLWRLSRTAITSRSYRKPSTPCVNQAVDDFVAIEAQSLHKGQHASTRSRQQPETEGLKNECFPRRLETVLGAGARPVRTPLDSMT